MIPHKFRSFGAASAAVLGLAILGQSGCSDAPPPPPAAPAAKTDDAAAKPTTPAKGKSSRPEKYKDEDSSARLRRENRAKQQ